MSNEKVWGGEFVSDTLNVVLDEGSNIVPLKDLVGLALRVNPKRAHLLVSKVLGKHIPVNPHLIVASSQILAVMVDEKLSGDDHGSDNLLELLHHSIKYDDVSRLMEALDSVSLTSEPVVAGYAETATALGAIVAEFLDAYYIHSTRYPDADSVNYGKFEESHSHASSHDITPADASYLNSGQPVVLVDDELTTGNTVMNTIRTLHEKAFHPHYVVASLVDLRTPEHVRNLEVFAEELGVPVSVVALSSGVVDLPETILADAASLIADVVWGEPVKNDKPVDVFSCEVIRFQHESVKLRNGVSRFDETRSFVDAAVEALTHAELSAASRTEYVSRNVLFLGLEEDMYATIAVASEFTSVFEGDVFFSSTTRSPVLAFDSDEYAIRDKIEFEVNSFEGDTTNRFAYNLNQNFDVIVIVVDSDEQQESLLKKDGLIGNLSHVTRKIILIKREDKK